MKYQIQVAWLKHRGKTPRLICQWLIQCEGTVTKFMLIEVLLMAALKSQNISTRVW